MELSISLECPHCSLTLPLPLRDLAPNHRKTCDRCQTPVQLTPAGLMRLAGDLRCYCEG